MAKGTCSVESCERTVRCRGWCEAHYARWRRGVPIDGEPVSDRVRGGCAVDGCDREHMARGWCFPHWKKWRRYGDPLVGAPAEDERFWSRVEKTDSCWNWTGSCFATGYASFWIPRRRVVAHRYAYELLIGPIPEGLQLDHMCHNRKCVNPDHLRPVTAKQNRENLLGATASNTSGGIRGVHWVSRVQKWRVTVGHNGRNHFGGTYADLDEAEQAAISLRNKLHTHNDADRGKSIA